tara:strand:+ start:10185 stop:10619 length:435 start_codon:yes stop_codon:yes gene_type:complete
VKSSPPKKEAVISLDVGFKRIGLAYCDPLHITVSILPALKRSKDYSEISILKEHIKKHNIKGIIIGLPLDDKGALTKQAIDCKIYGENIITKINIPFSFVNEHSSTWESINKYGLKKDKSGLIDSYSAKIILEQWMLEGPELKQ